MTRLKIPTGSLLLLKASSKGQMGVKVKNPDNKQVQKTEHYEHIYFPGGHSKVHVQTAQTPKPRHL